jgi:hypothetical protein
LATSFATVGESSAISPSVHKPHLPDLFPPTTSP